MNKKEEQFIKIVWEYYKQHGRHDLPWRKTSDPYLILVSEIMLQQTQVERVIPKYNAFLKRFGTVRKLAQSSLGEVLVIWQGLGYNRRAKMLHQCAEIVTKQHKGIFPKTQKGLVSLPGIGPYTAGAVLAFAYDISVPLIETNIRTVYLHHFFHDTTDVTDSEILRLVSITQDLENPRAWYYALMDYGSYLKKTHGNPNKKSAHYTKQSAFSGSDRQIRGGIIRALTKKPHSRIELHNVLSSSEDLRIDAQIERLKEEEMVVYKRGKYSLP
jgi:A/G-specific adenine glycosylase